MCCRPKTSFLIEDILQHSPTKTSDGVNATWLARPTPIYLNQVSPLHYTPDMVRMPATGGVYVSDGIGTEYGHDCPHECRSQGPTEPAINGAPYRGMT